MRKLLTAIALSILCLTAVVAAAVSRPSEKPLVPAVFATPYSAAADTVIGLDGDTIVLEVRPEDRHGRLDERDYEEVARELGVEVAAIKAVVSIEAGRTHEGFWAEAKPLINFDLSMFRQMARRNNISLGKYRNKHSVVFNRPNAAKYGSQQAAQQARLDAAMQIDTATAIQGTFWGMFQIGGFNWKKCGAESPRQFVELMSRSERDQLELFAEFIRESGLLPSLKAKNWARFARGYNGPGYARHNYHGRMARAYAKYKKEPQDVP